ncbi:MAG: hypothetical protein IPP51_09940 [Bacteroidetes bacterium]|nr:hypothetical protein [Bacteroidota bacterium]
MKRIFSLLSLFLILSFAASSKSYSDSTAVNFIGINTEYFFGSNALTNELGSTYFRNSFITDDMKDQVSPKLKDKNYFGAGFSAGVQYKHKPDSMFGLRHVWYEVNFSNNYHFSSDFSKDVFEVYFRGNKNYAKKTADLSDFLFRQLNYQQATFTFGHWFRHETNIIEWWGGFGINKGQKYLLIEAPRATVFTSEFGDYIDLDANLHIHRSDSVKNNITDVNGLGGTMQFGFKWTDSKKRLLRVQASNIGFISWNSKSSFVTADTAFRFEGVDISELFNFADTVESSINLDSSLVQPYLKNRTYLAETTWLPATIQVSYSIPVKKKWTMETGLSQTFNAESKLLIYQLHTYTITSNHTAALKLRYGGYSGFHIGLSYQYSRQGWRLRIGSDYVDALFLKNGRAQGAFVSLGKYF